MEGWAGGGGDGGGSGCASLLCNQCAIFYYLRSHNAGPKSNLYVWIFPLSQHMKTLRKLCVHKPSVLRRTKMVMRGRSEGDRDTRRTVRGSVDLECALCQKEDRDGKNRS